ncbi:hypothetical protein [Streptomyces sp. NPDC054838]
MSNEARTKAANLARDIWRGIWPHIEMNDIPQRRHRDNQRPDPSFRLAPLTSGNDVKPGDLVLSLRVDRNYHYTAESLLTHTAREAVGHFQADVVRVESAADKTLRVRNMVNYPQGGIAGADLRMLGADRDHSETVSYRLPSAKRLLARLGTVEDIRAKLAAHPLYTEWEAAYAAALIEEKAEAADTAKWVAEQEKRLAPLRTAVADFNRIAGEKLLRLSVWDESPDIQEEWLRKGNRMRIYLAGLNAVGRLDDTQHAAALEHLRTLGLNTAVKES